MKEYTVKVFEDGSASWYLDGKRHREDGPAVEFSNGTKGWYLDGKLHREDGPAVERENGRKEWYLHGDPITEEDHDGRRPCGRRWGDSAGAGCPHRGVGIAARRVVAGA